MDSQWLLLCMESRLGGWMKFLLVLIIWVFCGDTGRGYLETGDLRSRVRREGFRQGP